MEFIRQEGENLIIQNLFNEQHAGQLISSVSPTFNCIQFRNVGIKIMRLILNYLEEARITDITIDYNWNRIMTTPQLVCYDKNQWKTLQQVQNWNREWCELFSSCYFCTSVTLNLECSWMDQQFVQNFLGGVSKIPNIQRVKVSLSSKNKDIQEILNAVSKAKIFPEYQYNFKAL